MRLLRACAAAAALAAASSLLGCATEGIEIHRLPPETPAADNAAAIQKAAALAEAAKAAETAGQSQAKTGRAEEDKPAPLTAADSPSF